MALRGVRFMVHFQWEKPVLRNTSTKNNLTLHHSFRLWCLKAFYNPKKHMFQHFWFQLANLPLPNSTKQRMCARSSPLMALHTWSFTFCVSTCRSGSPDYGDLRVGSKKTCFGRPKIFNIANQNIWNVWRIESCVCMSTLYNFQTFFSANSSSTHFFRSNLSSLGSNINFTSDLPETISHNPFSLSTTDAPSDFTHGFA